MVEADGDDIKGRIEDSLKKKVVSHKKCSDGRRDGLQRYRAGFM